jgi:hypothetical protein
MLALAVINISLERKSEDKIVNDDSSYHNNLAC